ncbi:DNA-processing protein DprA [Agromyces sp. MMS24-JH15]|uniref:DNA-processing protein DprA n=1 Tax=Agromyces sp. MMS24-JH15 TaxID=3243765 RepID=UPI00374A8C48
MSGTGVPGGLAGWLDRIGSLVAGVGRESDDRPAAARALLGGVAEPGDGLMGTFVEAFGADGLADLLLAARDGSALVRAVGDSGIAVRPKALEEGIARWMPRLHLPSAERALAQAGRIGARLVLPTDEAWPTGLDDLGAHAPLALWVRGDPAALRGTGPAIAVVGARAATGYGEHVTAELAAGLSDRGFTIVSGGAYGIDGMAHRAVLGSGGTTVAYLAGGVDRFYPAGHEQLLTRITASGALASEVPCGAAPTRWRFLQRNRLIAASSAATVVVEAGWRSGSLNTAGHAASLGRPLGAVPGPVTSAASAGCHRLLREYDAVCVTDADQVAELVGASASIGIGGGRTDAVPPDGPADAGGPQARPAPDAVRVLDALSRRSAREIDDVARRSGLDPRRVMGILGTLEAEGRAARRESGWLAR